jgi:biopolymer transport protein ExbB
MGSLQAAVLYFHKGGIIMWPILILSICTFAIAIERYLYYKTADSGAIFAQQLCEVVGQRRPAGGGEPGGGYHRFHCAYPGAGAGFCRAMQPERQRFMEAQAPLAIASLRNRLNYLGVIVTMSPLLGLLGTIVGMISTFSVFNLKAGAPMAITGGIGEALIATASGLCVAIVALVFPFLFCSASG